MLATKARPRVAKFSIQVPDRMRKEAAGDVKTFENSLATIGRSFLAPKAPSLFNHEIGFQVLDSDDDNSRAVGVFGFRIGRKLLYVPLFYRDGIIKGTEQLRDPKAKSAVPLSDNWVNKYLSEQGDIKPERVDRSDVRGTAQPSLWQLKYPPSKYASSKLDPADAKAITRDLAGAISRELPFPDRNSGFDLMKMAAEHPALLEGLGELATAYSWFGDALEKFHGRDKIAAALAEADAIAARAAKPELDIFKETWDQNIVPRPTKSAAASTLTVIRVSQVGLRRVGKPGGPKVEALYDPDEWEDLRGGENNYKDDRAPEMKSKVTLWVGGQLPDGETLANPSEHGIYEVLGEGHKYERCVVLMPLIGWAPSIGRCLVIKISDGAWCYTHPNSVWVRGQADQPELGKWVDGLRKVKKEVEGVPNGMFAGVVRVTAGEHAGGFAATVPFTKYDDGETIPLSNPGKGKRPYWAPFNPWEDRTDNFRGKAVQGHGSGPTIHDSSRDDHARKRVEVFEEASYPAIHGNQLYLPKDCGLVELGDKQFHPADGSDPERVLFSRNYGSGDKQVEISKNAGSWELLDPRTDTSVKYAQVTELEADLVECHGLSVPDAKKAVFQAGKSRGMSFLVKYSEEYKEADGVKAGRDNRMPDTGLALNFPNSPSLPFDLMSSPASFADDVVPSETSSSLRIPIQDMLMQAGAMDRYRMYPVDHGVQGGTGGIGNSGDPSRMGSSGSDLDAVAGAVRSGRRDLFDTSSFAALVKHKRLDTLLRETRRNLGSAVTSLADDLAHLYWNTDEWSDRFGEGEIGPIEDQLLSQFEKLGELVLTLQENATRNGPDMSILPEIGPSDNSEQGD